MISESLKQTIESVCNSEVISFQAICGGCIANAQRVTLKDKSYVFVKTAQHSSGMFQRESNGLSELKKANAIRIPNALYADENCLILEHINSTAKCKNFFSIFGQQFAKLHTYTADNYGFVEDNYIGSTPQLNIPTENEATSWSSFYYNKRLLFQYKLAEKQGLASDVLKKYFLQLENKIESILESSEEKPSVLHGDLWSGNYMSDENGAPCLIDPAVYYGNREADLAMTKVFGGFNSDFYNSYNESFPLLDGYEYRENIYKLYHILNHLNLFGTGYLYEAEQLLKFYF